MNTISIYFGFLFGVRVYQGIHMVLVFFFQILCWIFKPFIKATIICIVNIKWQFIHKLLS